jgi:hypothetical protein
MVLGSAGEAIRSSCVRFEFDFDAKISAAAATEASSLACFLSNFCRWSDSTLAWAHEEHVISETSSLL